MGAEMFGGWVLMKVTVAMDNQQEWFIFVITISV